MYCISYSYCAIYMLGKKTLFKKKKKPFGKWGSDVFFKNLKRAVKYRNMSKY